MKTPTLLTAFIFSLNIHLLTFLFLIFFINNEPVANKKDPFKFKIAISRNNIHANLAPIPKAIKNKNKNTSVTTQKIPDAVKNLTLSQDYISSLVIQSVAAPKETEAILINADEFEINTEIDVIFKAKIYINEKGLVEDIVVEETNMEGDKLIELKIAIGKLKFIPAIKEGKGIPSVKSIHL
ncbi:hypothetical protein [Deefgea salmonis]|uniref:Uncharacterized protein n=1 Tax=Deefgea salmonis TaxID=2875502 RepID=A0ABS8BMK6_9NEIS|nr:hypothetical protein [Deefgea salmonis]MCB5196960.1 hypothetical protein [Deefgea salmonis]